MAESSFTNLLKVLATAYQGNADMLRNRKAQISIFDGTVKTYQEIYDLCSRSAIIAKMKGLIQGGSISSGQWMQLKLQTDYMARTERDLRQRYRGRLDSYRTGSSGSAFIPVVLTDILQQIENINPGAS